MIGSMRLDRLSVQKDGSQIFAGTDLNNVVVGTVRVRENKDVLSIIDVKVCPNQRNKTFGTQLVLKVMHFFRTRCSRVVAEIKDRDDISAIGFFSKLPGFTRNQSPSAHTVWPKERIVSRIRFPDDGWVKLLEYQDEHNIKDVGVLGQISVLLDKELESVIGMAVVKDSVLVFVHVLDNLNLDALLEGSLIQGDTVPTSVVSAETIVMNGLNDLLSPNVIFVAQVDVGDEYDEDEYDEDEYDEDEYDEDEYDEDEDSRSASGDKDDNNNTSTDLKRPSVAGFFIVFGAIVMLVSLGGFL
jgi:hypothetical protein